jgi:hypothetical protein
MSSFQGEAGGRMIEVPGIFYLVERGFRMTFAAILSKPVLMHIPVAVGAVSMCNSPVLRDFLSVYGCGPVAFGTIYRLVFTHQGECGLVMIKSGGRAELVVSVTGGTIRSQGSLVGIFVTAGACLHEPQVGA